LARLVRVCGAEQKIGYC